MNDLPSYPNFTAIKDTHRRIFTPSLLGDIPNADINFSTLYAYGFDELVQLSALNGNLVVLHSYMNTRYLSLVGINNVDLSLKRLFQDTDILKYISKPVVKNVSSSEYRVTCDRDNSDYIYDLVRLTNSSGNKFQSLRQKSNRIKRVMPGIKFQVMSPDLHSFKIIDDFYLTLLRASKITSDEYNLEIRAIERLLLNKMQLPLVISGIMHDQRLVGFSINEKYNELYALGHFLRADTNFSKDIYSLLYRVIGSHLLNVGLKYVNGGQDLGIMGLRRKKIELRPIEICQKYTIEKRLVSKFDL